MEYSKRESKGKIPQEILSALKKDKIQNLNLIIEMFNQIDHKISVVPDDFIDFNKKADIFCSCESKMYSFLFHCALSNLATNRFVNLMDPFSFLLFFNVSLIRVMMISIHLIFLITCKMNSIP